MFLETDQASVDLFLYTITNIYQRCYYVMQTHYYILKVLRVIEARDPSFFIPTEYNLMDIWLGVQNEVILHRSEILIII